MVDLKESLKRVWEKMAEQEKLQKEQRELIDKIIAPCTYADICEITEQDEIEIKEA